MATKSTDRLLTEFQEMGRVRVTSLPHLTLADLLEMADTLGVSPEKIKVIGWLGAVELVYQDGNAAA